MINRFITYENIAGTCKQHSPIILIFMQQALREEQVRIVELLKESGIDDVIFVGHIFREASSGYKYFDNVTALKEHLASNPLKNVTILIKGSLSNRLSTIVDAL